MPCLKLLGFPPSNLAPLSAACLPGLGSHTRTSRVHVVAITVPSISRAGPSLTHLSVPDVSLFLFATRCVCLSCLRQSERSASPLQIEIPCCVASLPHPPAGLTYTRTVVVVQIVTASTLPSRLHSRLPHGCRTTCLHPNPVMPPTTLPLAAPSSTVPQVDRVQIINNLAQLECP